MADLIVTETAGVHRPRNVDWKRAAALLYGDWGTSKAYVIGLAFIAAGFASFPIILAVCGLTLLVAINYGEICRYFPDGGGVYSAARSQSRLLAVVGALLLVADLTVTAALSGWSALSYFSIPIFKEHIVLSTVGVLFCAHGRDQFFRSETQRNFRRTPCSANAGRSGGAHRHQRATSDFGASRAARMKVSGNSGCNSSV